MNPSSYRTTRADTNDPRRAFTLIELLVVITIIVVLLALLTPALDRAIYQAELAVCGTQLKGIAGGVTTYAMEHKRRYPHRVDSYQTETPDMLYNNFDDDEVATPSPRAQLSPYMSINGMFNDPLTESVELASNKFSHSWGARSMWFAYRFIGEDATHPIMAKIGDRWGFTADGQARRYSLLATDIDQIEEGFGAVYSSHPDHLGVMTNEVWEETTWATGVDDPGSLPFTSGVANAAHNWSRWVSLDTFERGAIDMNASYADASVARFMDVEWDAWQPPDDGGDDRIARVPVRAEGDYTDEYSQVPVR